MFGLLKRKEFLSKYTNLLMGLSNISKKLDRVANDLIVMDNLKASLESRNQMLQEIIDMQQALINTYAPEHEQVSLHELIELVAKAHGQAVPRTQVVPDTNTPEQEEVNPYLDLVMNRAVKVLPDEDGANESEVFHKPPEDVSTTHASELFPNLDSKEEEDGKSS